MHATIDVVQLSVKARGDFLYLKKIQARSQNFPTASVYRSVNAISASWLLWLRLGVAGLDKRYPTARSRGDISHPHPSLSNLAWLMYDY